MRLLFITQKVDKDDDVLGIYHQWIEELAVKIEKLIVVCLYRGRVELPSNVRVDSLGKEKSANRFLYLIKFYFYIWKLRREYDAVFVHMNSEYILLGGCFWKLFRKKIFLWYNHPLGSWRVRLAAKFCQKIFHTSPFAFAARFKNSKIMPVGIDTKLFKKDLAGKKRNNSLLYLGRISPIKNLDCLIEAVKILDEQGIDFRLSIIGSPARLGDQGYEMKIKQMAESLSRKGKIIFAPSIANRVTPDIYNAHAMAINLTDTGSFDKAILEAMACEALVVVSNKALQGVLPPELIFQEKNSCDLASKLLVILKMSQDKKEKYGRQFRNYVVKNHELKVLMDKLLPEISI